MAKDKTKQGQVDTVPPSPPTGPDNVAPDDTTPVPHRSFVINRDNNKIDSFKDDKDLQKRLGRKPKPNGKDMLDLDDSIIESLHDGDRERLKDLKPEERAKKMAIRGTSGDFHVVDKAEHIKGEMSLYPDMTIERFVKVINYEEYVDYDVWHSDMMGATVKKTYKYEIDTDDKNRIVSVRCVGVEFEEIV